MRSSLALTCCRWIVIVCALYLFLPLSPAIGQQRGTPQSASRCEKLRHAFGSIRFVAYTPSDYDPRMGHFKAASNAGIEADLKVLKPYFTGLVTYSCATEQGMDRIVPMAAHNGFQVIIGVWDVKSVRELETAVQLAKHYPKTVLAVIVGNETQVSNRADWGSLAAAIRLVQASLPDTPVSTSEPISSYGNAELRTIVDFHSPIVHWIFQGGDLTDPKAAVAWARRRVEALRSQSDGDKPILVKESGLPSGPAPFTPEIQAAYWRLWAKQGYPNSPDCATAFWEAFDAPWKPDTNPSQLAATEAFWGGWDKDHHPKRVIESLLSRP